MDHSRDHSHAHDHSHDHSHAHEHDHDHGHHHHHDEAILDGDEIVRRFTMSKGRAPTPDEEQQLREHGHTHEHFEHAGHFDERESVRGGRDWRLRGFTVGIGGPVGSGYVLYYCVTIVKTTTLYAEANNYACVYVCVDHVYSKTALMLALCRELKDRLSIAAVTNDIFTREDGEFLVRHQALPEERIRAIETGGCPHAAIREDISANLQACEDLTDEFDAQLVLVESGGGTYS